MGFTVKGVLRRVLRRGSEKTVSRRCLERPLEEHAPSGVRPVLFGIETLFWNFWWQSFGTIVGMLWTWEIAQQGKVSKSGYGRVQKAFLTLLGPGSKGLPRLFCTTLTLFCTSATPFRTSARGLLLAGSKRPFALSTFGNFHFSGNIPGPQLPKTIAMMLFVALCLRIELDTRLASGKGPATKQRQRDSDSFGLFLVGKLCCLQLELIVCSYS